MAIVLDVDHVSQLHDLFEMHVEQGLHHGAQLSVFKDGAEVFNAAGGTIGPSGGRTTPETPHLLFSCAKPLAAIPVHQLAERGEVGYEDIDRCRVPPGGLKGLGPEAAADIFNRDDVQGAVMPASTAIGTAGDLARLFAALANGGELEGTRILEEETVERATTLQAEVENDDTLKVPRRYALGFERAGLPHDRYGALSPKRVFGHGGLGSSIVWADPRENLAMAYVTNGVRAEAENRRRMNVVADAVRTAFDAT